jgi:hypothetical protein
MLCACVVCVSVQTQTHSLGFIGSGESGGAVDDGAGEVSGNAGETDRGTSGGSTLLGGGLGGGSGLGGGGLWQYMEVAVTNMLHMPSEMLGFVSLTERIGQGTAHIKGRWGNGPKKIRKHSLVGYGDTHSATLGANAPLLLVDLNSVELSVGELLRREKIKTSERERRISAFPTGFTRIPQPLTADNRHPQTCAKMAA